MLSFGGKWASNPAHFPAFPWLHLCHTGFTNKLGAAVARRNMLGTQRLTTYSDALLSFKFRNFMLRNFMRRECMRRNFILRNFMRCNFMHRNFMLRKLKLCKCSPAKFPPRLSF